MVVKLIFALVVLAIVLSVAVGGAFWYLKNQAELTHKERMKEKELQQERDEHLWSDE